MTDRNDLEMMKLPHRWPLWPILPLKRPGHILEERGVGFLAAGHGPKIYFGDIFALKEGSLKEILKDIPREEFPDYEDIIDSGWVID